MDKWKKLFKKYLAKKKYALRQMMAEKRRELGGKYEEFIEKQKEASDDRRDPIQSNNQTI